MPITVVFDTNYLRTFSSSDFLAGRIPPKLDRQIKIALARGDLVAIPNTVRLEANHWLATQSTATWQRQIDAHELLSRAGYEITPKSVEKPPHVDIASLLTRAFPQVHVLEPTIDDYREAEFERASARNRCPRNRRQRSSETA